VRRPRRALVLAVPVLLAGCAASQTVGGSGSVAPLSPMQVYRASAPGTLQVYGPLDAAMGTSEYAFGSGVLYDRSRGLAITNAHVVDGLTGVRVRFNDGSQTTATVLGQSPCDDIAVLRLAHVPASATALPLGDSNTVHTADNVAVLGYPASLAAIQSEHVVFTDGLVQSPQVRVDQYADLPVYPDTIQHSATINHGNSGGPLIDRHGEVVGINTLSNFGTSSEQVQGQYYSIAIDHVKPLLGPLSSGHSIGYAGWDLTPSSEVSLRTLFARTGYGTGAQGALADEQLSQRHVHGLIVTNVSAGSPAQDASVLAGEMVTRVGSHPVATVPQVCAALTAAQDSVTVSGVSLVSRPGVPALQPWRATLALH
jgi:S1-C subfamily serine protease